ncbi:MAG: RNA pseudouridine synthase [Bdellovibrionia bacterium]
MTIPVIHHESGWLAVDKPFGVSVHNNEEPEHLLARLERELRLEKLYPVHRLDKETSGVQVLALNENAAKELAGEFQKRTVQKIYLGVLRGKLKEAQGVWNQALTDKAEGRNNPAGISRERIPCETRYRTLKDSKYFSLCEFELITGRQHQIRKHSALTNHALVGDPRYGDKSYNEKIAGLYGTSRMFLHCARIVLLGKTLEAAEPPEFQALVLKNG